MVLVLDGQTIAGTWTRVDDALDAARRRANQAGRVLTRIELDGRELEDDGAIETSGRELHVASAEPGAAMAWLLGIAGDRLVDSLARHEAAAEALRRADIPESMPLIGEVLGSWDRARRTVTECSTALGVGVLSASETDLIAELTAILNRLKLALESRDWVTVCDAMAYELPPLARAWRIALQAMAAACLDAGRGTADEPGDGPERIDKGRPRPV